MIRISDTKLKLYQPTRLNLNYPAGPFTVNWEIVNGTGGRILNNGSGQFVGYFTEPGTKTIRARVQLAPGIEQTFDKTVTVAVSSIISAPATTTQGYPVTVSMMPLETFPNAKVTAWSVSKGEVEITQKRDNEAQYVFNQPGDITIQLKILFYTGAPAIEYSVPIKVKTQDIYRVFAVNSPPATYKYNTTYHAKYMGEGSNVEVTNIEIDHLTYFTYHEFDTWSYNKSTKTITFSVPNHEVAFDYKLAIFYKVNGVEIKEPAQLVISNIRDIPSSAH